MEHKKHPEQQDGEVFVENLPSGTQPRWATARFGEVAYTWQGEVIEVVEGAPKLRPLFVQEHEVAEAYGDEDLKRLKLSNEGLRFP